MNNIFCQNCICINCEKQNNCDYCCCGICGLATTDVKTYTCKAYIKSQPKQKG